MNDLLTFLSNGLLNFSVWQIVLYTLITTHITIAAVTIYLHRNQAHRALDLHPIVSHFFRFWLWIGTGQNTKAWAAIHRKHHAKCETDEDPHSPQTRGLNAVLWRGAELYRAEATNQETLDKYGAGTPDDWIERKLYTPYTTSGVLIMLVINVALFGLAGLTVWAIQMAWIPFWAAGVINGIAHYWGYRNFDNPDAARNIFPWGILIGGEELHNNHHTYATSAKLSNKWYEFDIGWLYIKLMSYVGLAKIKKTPPKPVFVKNIPVDEHTLESIIKNRYVVMASYARSLKSSFREELSSLKSTDKGAAKRFAKIKKALLRDSDNMSAEQIERVESEIKISPTMQKMYDMRNELATLWRRSNMNREQLLAHLHDWCDRAEQSGIEVLQRFAGQLRTYR